MAQNLLGTDIRKEMALARRYSFAHCWMLMRILIGLFQHRQEILQVTRAKGIDPASLTEVGPFFSREQAYSWMQELHSRIENSEIAHVPEKSSDDLQWYGFTLEAQR